MASVEQKNASVADVATRLQAGPSANSSLRFRLHLLGLGGLALVMKFLALGGRNLNLDFAALQVQLSWNNG